MENIDNKDILIKPHDLFVDIIEKSNYPFHVLMVNKNDVFESYG